jgi:hypothetical protein
VPRHLRRIQVEQRIAALEADSALVQQLYGEIDAVESDAALTKIEKECAFIGKFNRGEVPGKSQRVLNMISQHMTQKAYKLQW